MSELREWPKSTFLTGQRELSSVFSVGLDRIADFQKAVINIYASQTVSAMRSTRYIFPMMPSYFLDMVEQGITEFARMQTRFVDLIAKEARESLNAVKTESSKGIDQTWKLIGDAADRTASTQKKTIDLASPERLARNTEDYSDDVQRQVSDLLKENKSHKQPKKE